jgi:hypothetical protein
MQKSLIAACAAITLFASAAAFSNEVQLTEQEKSDLRERAGIYQREGRQDRTMELRRSAGRMARNTRDRMEGANERAASSMYRANDKIIAKTHRAKNKVKQKARRAKDRVTQTRTERERARP